MNPRKIRLYIDLFFCIIFLPLIITLIPVEKWMTNYPIFATTLICFLYLLYFSVQIMNYPQKVLQKKWWQLIVFSLVAAGFAYLIAHFPYPSEKFEFIKDSHDVFYRRRIQTVWFLFLVISGYSLSVSLLMGLYQQTLVQKELETKKKNAELALYHAQINPHFFFNTMNTLYGLLLSKSPKTENAFLQFTELLKYTYSLANTSYIPITKGVKFIENYIDLQKLRLNGHTNVIFSTSIEDEEVQVSPLLCISFVENAFKYGVSSTKDSKIEVNISQKGNIFEFICINDIVKSKDNSDEMSIGIENTRSRLDLLYPNKYELFSKEIDNKFIVKLKLTLR